MQSAAEAVTTAELARLTSDLGAHEVTHPLYSMAILCGLVIIVAAWEPVLLSGAGWLALAVPVTVIAGGLMWALPEFLV